VSSLGPERPDGPLTPPPLPVELPPPAPVEGQVVQPEHDHTAAGEGKAAVAAVPDTATGGATRGTTRVAAGVPASVENEADPFGSAVEHERGGGHSAYQANAGWRGGIRLRRTPLLGPHCCPAPQSRPTLNVRWEDADSTTVER